MMAKKLPHNRGSVVDDIVEVWEFQKENDF